MALGAEWCHAELLALAAVSLRFFGCSLQPCSRFGGGTRGTPLAVWDVLALDAAVLVVGASSALLLGSHGVVALHPGGTSTASPPCACSLQHSLPPGPAGRTGHSPLSLLGHPLTVFNQDFGSFCGSLLSQIKNPETTPLSKPFHGLSRGEIRGEPGGAGDHRRAAATGGTAAGTRGCGPRRERRGRGRCRGPAVRPRGLRAAGAAPGAAGLCGAPAAAAPPRSRPRPGAEQDAATSASRSARRGPGGR